MDYYGTFLQYCKMGKHAMDPWSWSKGPLSIVVQISFIRPFSCCC